MIEEKQTFHIYGIVDVSSNSILFYTYPKKNTHSTVLWEYNVDTKETRECFTFSGSKIMLWLDEIPNQYLYITNSLSFGERFIGKLDSDGNIIWEYKLATSINEPSADKEGNIYVSTGIAWLYCFDRNGNLKWRWKPQPVKGKNLKFTDGIHKFEILDKGIYVFTEGGFYILSKTGDIQECYEMPAYSGGAHLYVSQDKIIVTHQRKVTCHSLTGEHIWEYDAPQYISGKISHDRYNNLYFMTTDLGRELVVDNSRKEDAGWLFSLDKDGKERWVIESFYNSDSPHIYGEEIIITGGVRGKEAEAYSLSGEKKWEYQEKGFIAQLIVLGEEIISISESRGNLYITHSIKNTDRVLKKTKVSRMVEQEREIMSKSKWDSWKRNLTEYVERGIDIWLKYHVSGELSEVRLYYEEADYLIPEVYIDGKWYKLEYDAGVIDGWLSEDWMTDDIRDEHKECGYLSTMWQEFCETEEEKDPILMLQQIASEVANKYQAKTSLIADS